MPLKFGLFSMTTGPCSYPETATAASRGPPRRRASIRFGRASTSSCPIPRRRPRRSAPADRSRSDRRADLPGRAHEPASGSARGSSSCRSATRWSSPRSWPRLDVLSNGRLIFGVGVGYLEPEFRALGARSRERGRVTDEYLAAMRAIWTEAAAGLSRPLRRLRARAGAPAARPEADAADRHRRPHAGGFRRAVEQGHGWYGFALDTAATTARASRACARRRRRHAAARAAAARDQRVPARTHRSRRRGGVRRPRRAPPDPDPAALRGRRGDRAIRRDRIGPGRPRQPATAACGAPDRAEGRAARRRSPC